MTGDITFVSDIVAICTEFFVSYAQDLFGRKLITIAGLVLAASATIFMTIPSQVMWLYLLTSLANIGSVAALYSPYTVDYVKKESLGILAGYISICATLSGFLTTTVAI